ncbi:unnamed protein product [Hermetia illucens]|uniref:Amino acid transporter n=1 Tax=Hermetia illucens TaxID=343691 RepID=A0A7R8URV0_HERIL|nr:excitatory amino acid transporter 1 [Hermetia illucens]XP_037909964.1 excitatory amino acid transporter 1 [Hermetia illucens]XP_037909965.1 excitatory amino acid transporter 1 [Hermetia illucens]XP_037909966.1 excitatory amino acid transporter 1 [Hermetia illucens]XP_037909967.1 excitatory amino acid transporter 1 [Hermetia illucens]CAD7085465.1 unnamed protein product [Hermetia illucens]
MSRPKNRLKGFMGENLLTLLTVIGVVCGTITGLLIKNNTGAWTPREIMYISYPGDLFLSMLKCLIVPLLVSSIVSAIGSLDLSMSGKIAMRACIYYMLTTIFAVILGIILVTTIRPGESAKLAEPTKTVGTTKQVLTQDTLMDLIRNLFPSNIVQAAMFQYRTELIKPANSSDDLPLEEYEMKGTMHATTNVLGLVMFSIALGVTIGKLREKGQPLQDFFVTLSEAMMIITSWVIWISPLGVYFLVTAKLIEMESLAVVVSQLGFYFMTVMLGLIIHGLGTIPMMFFVATRQFPYKYIGKMTQVIATAFGTGSSSATMPITINCLDSMGMDPRVTRFVIPVGATINMDGTALYEAVAALFIAQFRGVSYSFGTIVAVSITATAASIGAAGIPQAGLVTMVMVLDTVGLPSSDITLIVAVDWLLDRFRTTINVVCDAFGTILVNKLSQNDLNRLDKEHGEPHELVELNSGDREFKE